MEINIYSPKHGHHIAHVDKQDFELVNKYVWGIAKRAKTTYAFTYIEKGKQVFMHRLLMDAKPGSLIDHADGNGLNNVRSNLRITGWAQNATNTGLRSTNTTGFKGVSFNKKANKFIVSIRHNYTQIHGGLFDDIHDAAKRYNELALKYHGQFAKLNDLYTRELLKRNEVEV